jgi:hypothetical protein
MSEPVHPAPAAGHLAAPTESRRPMSSAGGAGLCR